MVSRQKSALDGFMQTFAVELAKAVADPRGYVEALRPPPEGNPITLGELVLPAEDWAKKQMGRAKAASADWLARSLKPRKVPSKAALDANDKRVDKLQASIRDRTWEGAMGKVNEDERLETIASVGSAGFERGIESRTRKIERVVAELQPAVVALKKALDGLPEKTDAEREAKMIAAKRGMQAIGKVRRGVR